MSGVIRGIGNTVMVYLLDTDPIRTTYDKTANRTSEMRITPTSIGVAGRRNFLLSYGVHTEWDVISAQEIPIGREVF